jgi:hypothetical protein
VNDLAESARERRFVGLCADCQHARRVESSRGSPFYLCQRSASDAAFPKYPRLPVIQCSGYAPSQREGS